MRAPGASHCKFHVRFPGFPEPVALHLLRPAPAALYLSLRALVASGLRADLETAANAGAQIIILTCPHTRPHTRTHTTHLLDWVHGRAALRVGRRPQRLDRHTELAACTQQTRHRHHAHTAQHSYCLHCVGAQKHKRMHLRTHMHALAHKHAPACAYTHKHILVIFVARALISKLGATRQRKRLQIRACTFYSVQMRVCMGSSGRGSSSSSSSSSSSGSAKCTRQVREQARARNAHMVCCLPLLGALPDLSRPPPRLGRMVAVQP